MKELRLTLYLVVGLFLGAVSALSFAETIPATTGYHTWYGMNYQGHYPDPLTACQSYVVGNPTMQWSNVTVDTCWGDTATGWGQCTCKGYNGYYGRNDNVGGVGQQGATYGCPSGQNWTLQGSNCVRPDCVAPQVRDPATGVCSAPPNPCASKTGTVEGWAEKGTGYNGTKCIDGCTYNQSFLLDLSNPQDERIAKDGKIWGPVSQTGTGQQCTASESTPSAPEPRPKDNPNKPPCGAGEGVIGTSTGKVLCLPEGNPDVRKPDVKKDDKLETFPDGSKKKTETITTRDPVTNNKDVAVNVTVTAGAGGGTMAGTPGTTTSSAQSTGQNGGIGGEGSGDGQCSKEPNSPMCKAGNVKAKGDYGNGQDAEIEAAKNELRQKFAEVKAQASAMFSGNLTGGAGSLPCYAPITVLGQQMSMCFTKYESSLGVIGGFVMLMAALGAAFIILRR